MKVLRFKALLPVTVDIEKLWFAIKDYNRVNLGGESSQYTVFFTGSIPDGMEVLGILLEFEPNRVEINTDY